MQYNKQPQFREYKKFTLTSISQYYFSNDISSKQDNQSPQNTFGHQDIGKQNSESLRIPKNIEG